MTQLGRYRELFQKVTKGFGRGKSQGDAAEKINWKEISDINKLFISVFLSFCSLWLSRLKYFSLFKSIHLSLHRLRS